MHHYAGSQNDAKLFAFQTVGVGIRFILTEAVGLSRFLEEAATPP